MKQITEIRCSQLSRPMTCAGSLFFEDLPVDEAGDAAKEGTACGEYLERLLTNQPLISHAKNGVAFDNDMKFYAGEAAKEIQSRAQSPILCEQRVDWQTRSGIWIKGSYDISYVHDNKLVIDDLKYGWRIVDVKDNWQLLAYAIGEVLRRKQNFDHVVLRIIQPRPHHEDGNIREWTLSMKQLGDYREMIEERCHKIAQGYAELCTSPKCKYCPAAMNSACTAFNRAVFHGIDYVMSDFKQDHITENEIAFQLELLDRVTDILKIKKESVEQLAVSKIKEGLLIPNYMTEASYGDRKWKGEVTPEAIKMMTGFDIIEKVMLSPAKAEKLGVSKDLIKGLVDRHFLKMKLVRKDASKLADKIFNNKQ